MVNCVAELDSLFTYQLVTPEHHDFQALVGELNASLTRLTQDSGESSFVAEEYHADSDRYGVVYVANEPVACGGFRAYDAQCAELKRMYSKRPGAGSYLLEQLHQAAAELGYRRLILSTRRVNQAAVQFYRKHGYQECTPYGKYVGRDVSICMSKVCMDKDGIANT